MSIEQPKISNQEGENKISRRDFLGLLGTTACIAGGGALLYPNIKKSVEEKFFSDEAEKNAEAIKREIETKYGIELFFDGEKNNIPSLDIDGESGEVNLDWEKLSPVEKNNALAWFYQIIFLLPPEFIKATNLKRVGLVKELKNVYQSGVKTKKQGIGGIALADGTFIANCSINNLVASWFEDELVRSAFFHEIFHLAELKEVGLIKERNFKWAQLNPEGGDAYMRDLSIVRKKEKEMGIEKLGELIAEHKGFVDNYSMKNEVEDRASLAAFLLANPDSQQVLFERDKVLFAKSEFIKKLFFEWTGGKMNESFWKDLAERKIKTGYWDK